MRGPVGSRWCWASSAVVALSQMFLMRAKIELKTVEAKSSTAALAMSKCVVSMRRPAGDGESLKSLDPAKMEGLIWIAE
jgi:hypothetical protein